MQNSKQFPSIITMVFIIIFASQSLIGQSFYLSTNAGAAFIENKDPGFITNFETGYKINKVSIGVGFTNYSSETTINPLAEWNKTKLIDLDESYFQNSKKLYHRKSFISQKSLSLNGNYHIIDQEKWTLSVGVGGTYYWQNENDLIINTDLPPAISTATYIYSKNKGLGWHTNIKGLVAVKPNTFIGLMAFLENNWDYIPAFLLTVEFAL